MTQQGGLGRGLASLIPQKSNKQQKKKEIRKTDEDQSYLGYLNQDKEKDYKEDQPKSSATTKRKKVIKSAVESVKKPKRERESVDKAKEESKEQQDSQGQVVMVAVERIMPNPHQPRAHFNEDKLVELADSIKEHGIIQPLIVTVSKEGDYELIAGERRLEAGKLAGLAQVPVIIKTVNDQKKAEWALIENVQRHDLSPLEEAKAYKKMQENFSMTQEEVALRVGKSRSTVANSLRLLRLPVEIQKALINEKISEGHAKTILAISNPEKQRALFELILKENLNVRQTERKVREVLGGGPRKKGKEFDPEIYSKQEQLSQSLGTKVKIKKGAKGGKIVIDFYSEEEFDALLTSLITQDD